MINTRFAVSLHVLRLLAAGPRTSQEIGQAIGTNAVVIRRLIAPLKRAGLVVVSRAAGGSYLARDPANIRLHDVWAAVRGLDPAIGRHAGAPDWLNTMLDRAEEEMMFYLAQLCLQDLVSEAPL